MTVYDCFMFYDEFDILELRLEELDDFVDRFVLIEGSRDFRGRTKEFLFTKFKDRFSSYLHKIDIIQVDLPTPEELQRITKATDCCYFGIENLLRSTAIVGLTECKDDDIVMLSDVDEIPDKHRVWNKVVENPDKIMAAQMELYALFLNYRWIQEDREKKWVGTVFSRFANVKNMAFNAFRNDRANYMRVRDCGWHFTFIGMDRVTKKLATNAEPDAIKNIDVRPEAILERVKQGKNIFDDKNGDVFEIIWPLDDKFPRALVQNTWRYNAHLTDKSLQYLSSNCPWRCGE